MSENEKRCCGTCRWWAYDSALDEEGKGRGGECMFEPWPEAAWDSIFMREDAGTTCPAHEQRAEGKT